MGKRTGAEVGVAAVIRSDHIQPQLQGFRHATAEALGAAEGEPLSRPKGLGPAEVAGATDAGDTHGLQLPNGLQP